MRADAGSGGASRIEKGKRPKRSQMKI